MMAAGAPDRAGDDRLDRYEFSEIHMGTRVRVILFARDRLTAEQGARSAMARIARIDAVGSDYRNDSDLTRFVESSGQGLVPIDPELFRLLDLSRQWAKWTGGIFDVTLAPVVQLWRRARRTKQLPDPQRLQQARRLVGIRHLKLDSRTGRASLARTGMRIDLGGIAKGYAANEALAELTRLGVARALVAIGGDIVAGEPPPGESGWRVGVAPLDQADQKPELSLSLHNAAVSTSGDASQSVTIDGKRYSHIVDPRTGIGLIGHRSVTVVSSNGATSDVLATTLSILGAEEGLRLLDRLAPSDPKLAALLVDQSRRVESKRWPSHLAP